MFQLVRFFGGGESRANYVVDFNFKEQDRIAYYAKTYFTKRTSKTYFKLDTQIPIFGGKTDKL